MARGKAYVITIFLIAFSSAFYGISYYNASSEKEIPLSSNEDLTSASRHKQRVALWKGLEENFKNETKFRRLPDIIGIGVEKCGTGALFHFLRFHPSLRIATKNLEVHYFDTHGYKYSKDEYMRFFPEVEKSAFVAEKSPAYFSFPPHTIPKAIHTTAPKAKLLLILCDPVKRVLSDYVQEQKMYELRHPRSITKYATLEDYLDAYLPLVSGLVGDYNEHKSSQQMRTVLQLHGNLYLSTILTTGFYALHLHRWFEYYNNSNLMVIDGEELINNPGPLMEKVQDYTGLPKLVLKEDLVMSPEKRFYCYKDWQENKLRCLGNGKGRTRNGNMEMLNTTASKLRDFYRSYNEGLVKMLGRNLSWT
ncbi:heparan sulfate glucosamine 3-O-sulfotransferase 1-like [Clavelina lepadiformis]|uniref:heparan sulfate glucosamine 3-O-sulfotransferase 1-like n=1 Tax=Clavelina lepadiformis TaxID=159417 RepID=UPI004041A4E3